MVMESPGKMHMKTSWKVTENHFHYSIHNTPCLFYGHNQFSA